MAKVIVDEQTRIAVIPWWGKFKVPIIGAGLGILWWILTSILRSYVVEPLACRDLVSANACVDSFGLAGNIATVLIAILGIFVLIKALQPRPIIIAVASAVLLWSLGSYVNGLVWFETLIWAVILYTLSYTLFSFVARIHNVIGGLIVAVVVVVAIRLLLVF